MKALIERHLDQGGIEGYAKPHVQDNDVVHDLRDGNSKMIKLDCPNLQTNYPTFIKPLCEVDQSPYGRIVSL